MKQVIKDRIARIDKEIDELVVQCNAALEREREMEGKIFFANASGSKGLLARIQALTEKKEEITDKALYGSMAKTKFERGMEDRQTNLAAAQAEALDIARQFGEAALAGDTELAKELKHKLGNANRIVAIYENSLDNWKNKEDKIVFKKEAVRKTILEPTTERAIYQVDNPRPADPEVLRAIELLKNKGKELKPEANKTNIAMITPTEADKINGPTDEHDKYRPKEDIAYDNSIFEKVDKPKVVIDFGE